MFFRYFFALCAIVLFAIVVNGVPVVESEPELEYDSFDVEPIEARNAILKVVMKILKGAFKWAATSCLIEAADNCKQHWNHPTKIVDCAKKFLASNKGRCVVG